MVKHFRKGSCATSMFISVLLFGSQALASSETETAELLIKLLQVGRGVVSENDRSARAVERLWESRIVPHLVARDIWHPLL